MAIHAETHKVFLRPKHASAFERKFGNTLTGKPANKGIMFSHVCGSVDAKTTGCISFCNPYIVMP